jgi:manganese efflux pump family protein
LNNLDFVSVLIIALGLSADCFAVAFGGSCSAKKITTVQVLRISFFFGAFQAIMPTLGWLLGRTFVDLIGPYDHWLVFGLLAFVGGRMVWEFFHDKEESEKEVDITRGVRLLILSFATSIDALAAGLSFALLEVNIVLAVVTIGVTSFLLTGAGFISGRTAGRFLGRWAELAGGLVLIGIGLRILIEHLLG